MRYGEDTMLIRLYVKLLKLYKCNSCKIAINITNLMNLTGVYLI